MFSENSLWQVGWLLAATVIAGSFNYLANVLVGKLLGPEEYGIYAALLAFSIILGAPTSVIHTIVANYCARFAATSSSFRQVNTLLRSALRSLLPLGVAGVILIAIFSGLIATFLHIPSFVPVVVVGFSLLPTVLLPVSLGGLQGLQRFGRYGSAQIASGGLRLILGIGLVLLGWGVAGALAGGILAGLGAFMLGWWWLQDVVTGPRNQEAEKPGKSILRKELSSFSANVILAVLSFMVLTYIDTIVVKNRFAPLEAGLYSATATIGRVVLYAPMAVVTFMFPRIAGEHAQGNSTARPVRLAMLVTAGLCSLGVLIFSIRPELVMGLLFGQQFLGEAALLVPYTIAMLLLALVNVWMYYFLAVQESRYTLFMLVAAVLVIIVLFSLPLSLRGVVWTLAICAAVLVLAGEGLLRFRHGQL